MFTNKASESNVLLKRLQTVRKICLLSFLHPTGSEPIFSTSVLQFSTLVLK